MERTVSFPLFADGGFVNPTSWAAHLPPESLGPAVWDFSAGRWRAKQTREFDGGWRWYDQYDKDILVLYNVKLSRQAHTDIPHLEIEDTLVGPEFVLMCAKSRVILEHNFFTAREFLQDKIRADFLRLRRELFGTQIRSA